MTFAMSSRQDCKDCWEEVSHHTIMVAIVQAFENQHYNVLCVVQ